MSKALALLQEDNVRMMKRVNATNKFLSSLTFYEGKAVVNEDDVKALQRLLNYVK